MFKSIIVDQSLKTVVLEKNLLQSKKFMNNFFTALLSPRKKFSKMDEGTR